jgi:RecA-family ATPase
VNAARTNGATPPDPKAERDAEWMPRVRLVTQSWFTEAPPARTWLLRDMRRDGEGVLPLGKAGELVAAGGVGKTMLNVSLALAVASGTPWLGTFSVASPGRVLMLLGEEDEEEVKRRIYNGARGMAKPPESGRIEVLPLAGVPCALLERADHQNTISTDFAAWLDDYVEKHGPWSLILLDPLSRFAGPDAEKDNAQGTRFVQSIERLSTLTRATTLASHHTAKLFRQDGANVPAEASRGSTSLVDGFRWQGTLGVATTDAAIDDDLKEIVTLSFTKSNYSRRTEPLKLKRDEHGQLHPLDAVEREMVAKAFDKKAKNQAAKEEARRKQNDEDDDAARALLAERPDAPVRTLRAELMKRRACGGDRAQNAIRRVRGDA